MKSFKFILVFFSVFMLSCNETPQRSDTPVISLKDARKENPLKNIKRRVVRLKSGNDTSIGNISIVHADANKIFVCDMRMIHIFDTNGNYLSSIPQGSGSNEVLRPITFKLDFDLKRIYIVDNCQSIAIFDYNGEFISRYRIDGFGFMDLIKLDEDNFLLHSSYVGGSQTHFIGQYNLREQKIIKRFIPAEESDYPLQTIIAFNDFSEFNNSITYFSPNIFNIYRLEEFELKKIASIDLGNKRVPDDFSKPYKGKTKLRAEFRDESKKSGYIPQLTYCFEFNNYYFIGLDDPEASCLIANKSDFSKTFCFGSIIDVLGLPDVSMFRFPKGSHNRGIILQANSVDFYDKDEDQYQPKNVLIGNTMVELKGIDDYPVLVFVE